MGRKAINKGLLGLIALMAVLLISGCVNQKENIVVENVLELGEIEDLLISGAVLDIDSGKITYTIGNGDFKAEVNSALKPYMATQLVERGKITWDSVVDDAPVQIGEQTIRCWIYPKQHGEETFEQSIIQSCRPPIAQAASELTCEEAQEIFAPLDIEVSTPLTGEELVKMAVGAEPELSAEQLVKAYGSVAADNEKLCAVMGEIAKRKIEGISDTLGMAKGRGESSEIVAETGEIGGHEVDTVVLLWPIDSPEICCVLQYPWEKEADIYKWVDSLELAE